MTNIIQLEQPLNIEGNVQAGLQGIIDRTMGPCEWDPDSREMVVCQIEQAVLQQVCESIATNHGWPEVLRAIAEFMEESD